jgi:PKD repeat protein
MKKLRHQMKHAYAIPLLAGLLLMNLTSANNQASSSEPICTDTGTLFFNYNSPCEPFILLDNGLYIQPYEFGYPEIFTDSLRVAVSYEVIDSLSNSCINGLLVEVTCFRIIDWETDCQAQFVWHPINITMDVLGPDSLYQYIFEDVTTDSVVNRCWFVDGDSLGNEPVQFYEFNEPGIHTVCLSIETLEGCYDHHCEELFIGGQSACNADFDYIPDEVFIMEGSDTSTLMPGYPYWFIDSSMGNVVEWTWTVEGVEVDTSPEVYYVFTEPGAYEVCLSILTDDSCSSSICKTIYVDTLTNCMADFDYYKVRGDSNNYADTTTWYIHFISTSYGNITSWLWDFGDGTTSTEQHPVHAFPAGNMFDVCLSISTTSGCHDIQCKTVITDTSQTVCNAMFEYCNYSVNSNDSLSEDMYVIGFKNLSSPDFAYSMWDFGDGSSSNERNPAHIYDQPGVYNVCLAIYTDGGCWDSICQPVQVGPGSCMVDFTREILVPDCAGYEIAYLFVPVTWGVADSYHWDFGDGTEYYGEEATHIYEYDGIYTVCLEVEYPDSCVATQCKTIEYKSENADSVIYNKCVQAGINAFQDIDVTNAYPVPASEMLSLDVYCRTDTEISFQLFNAFGQVLEMTNRYHLVSGENTLEIPLNRVKTGTYIYKITSARMTTQGRISVIK